jgi:hypothetical protein
MRRYLPVWASNGLNGTPDRRARRRRGKSVIGSPTHSVRKLFIGFATAARMAWKLIVRIAMPIDSIPAAANTHHDMPECCMRIIIVACGRPKSPFSRRSHNIVCHRPGRTACCVPGCGYSGIAPGFGCRIPAGDNLHKYSATAES